MTGKRVVSLLILSFAIVTVVAVVAFRSAGWWRQNPIQNSENGIVIVPGPVDTGYSTAQPLSKAPTNANASITEAGDTGSNARSALPDPTVEALLERGSQDDLLASQQRMLERQKLAPGGIASSAANSPGPP